MRLSIIIPALDEASTLPKLLQQLHAQQNILCEILVADGGSRTGPTENARRAGFAVGLRAVAVALVLTACGGLRIGPGGNNHRPAARGW